MKESQTLSERIAEQQRRQAVALAKGQWKGDRQMFDRNGNPLPVPRKDIRELMAIKSNNDCVADIK